MYYVFVFSLFLLHYSVVLIAGEKRSFEEVIQSAKKINSDSKSVQQEAGPAPLDQEITELPSDLPEDIKALIFSKIMLERIRAWKPGGDVGTARVELLRDMLFLLKYHPQYTSPMMTMLIEQKPYIIKDDLDGFIQFLEKYPPYTTISGILKNDSDILNKELQRKCRLTEKLFPPFCCYFSERKELFEQGANPHVPGHKKQPLHIAARREDLQTARLLIEAGADANVRDKNGKTPLHKAASFPHKDAREMIHLLIEAGGNIHAKNYAGESPLHRTAAKGYTLDALYALIDAGADVNAQDALGRTPLHRAASRDHYTMIHYLIIAGAHVDIKDHDGKRPLHDAASSSSFESAKILITAGADINSMDKNSLKPVDHIPEVRTNSLMFGKIANLFKLLKPTDYKPVDDVDDKEKT